ncbi:uncharacterized protein Dana_GF15288 [Drosophila ananassae]|uniref:MSP domain-containing protein n=2 Tax=Drosophila ananassae TaxID=7217 RepID=B3MPK4_DROAN|nr:uncharacterized protein Dana_GF15288 [Drosophila ananassae]
MELLSVSPQLLNFYAPYDRRQRRILTLLNPTNSVVLFKVTSNAWKHYRVSPIAAKIEPYDTQEVSISLSYFDFDENKKYAHRFRIQSMYDPPDRCKSEKVLAIFLKASRCDISTLALPVNLEAKPISLSNSYVKSTPCLKKIAVERNEKLRPLCSECPTRLKMYKNTKNSEKKGFLSKLVLVGSLMGVFLTAYLQRQMMQELLMNNLFPDQGEPEDDFEEF